MKPTRCVAILERGEEAHGGVEGGADVLSTIRLETEGGVDSTGARSCVCRSHVVICATGGCQSVKMPVGRCGDHDAHVRIHSAAACLPLVLSGEKPHGVIGNTTLLAPRPSVTAYSSSMASIGSGH